MIRARPTTYKGIQMRSRLEAYWAAQFDQMGWEWEYEPMCFADETGQYLPDFYVVGMGGGPAYVEIKPPLDDDTVRDVAQRMSIIWSSEPTVDLKIFTGTSLLSGFTFKRNRRSWVWKMYREDGTEWQWLVGVPNVIADGWSVTQLDDGSFLVEEAS